MPNSIGERTGSGVILTAISIQLRIKTICFVVVFYFTRIQPAVTACQIAIRSLDLTGS